MGEPHIEWVRFVQRIVVLSACSIQQGGHVPRRRVHHPHVVVALIENEKGAVGVNSHQLRRAQPVCAFWAVFETRLATWPCERLHMSY